MSMKKLTSSILAGIKTGVQDANLNNRDEITTYVLSGESMDKSGQEVAASALERLNDTVEDTLQMVLGQEDYESGQFTDAQYAAAKAIAGLAANPKEYIGNIDNLKQVQVSGAQKSISVESLGVEDAIPAGQISAEAFDGQSISNAMFFSIAYNFGAARQDAFGEAFFPTVVIDPAVSGFNIETEFTSLMTEFERSVTGSLDSKKFNRVPIVKAIYDNDLFSNDKNKVVPVKRAENADLFVAGYEFADTTAGESITTAPLKFGKKFSLLGISQTDALLAKGVMDNTDALDRTMNIDKIFYSITGDNGSGSDVTDLFAVNASVFPHSNFTYSTQDHMKDLSLAFSTESVIVNTGNTKTVQGAASAVLAQLPADHSVKLGLTLHGDSNTQSGDLGVYASRLEVVAIYDAAGNELPSTNGDYATIKAVFDNLKLEGYTVEAYRTNSNLRTRGQLITSDRYNQIYTVPLRSGITVQMPVNNNTGTDNDAAKLTSQIQAAGIKTSIYAVKTLVEHADMLHNVTNNGADINVDLMGIARHHVDPYYNEITIDLADFVDSVKSSERIADIRAALLNKIKDEALNMYTMSNYGVALEVLRGNVGGKTTVLIGTDPKTKNYITGGESKISLGDDFEAVVVSTPNKLIKGKIYITFGVFDDQRNVVANPLNFGVCAWAPTITTDVVRTVGGSTTRELHNVPRFLHVVNLPIMARINVSDTNAVLEKIAGHRKTIV